MLLSRPSRQGLLASTSSEPQVRQVLEAEERTLRDERAEEGPGEPASWVAVLDPLGAPGQGRSGQPAGGELAAALGGRAGHCLGVGAGGGPSREPLVLSTGLGLLVLGLDELAGAGVGQDEAAGQAGVEDHDEQDVEIGIVALGAGHLAAHEGVGHDPHAHARAGAGAQATGVAPVMQLQQQAAQQGPQTLTLAAVHGCRGVTRRLQIAVDLAPGPGRGDAGGRAAAVPGSSGRAAEWLGGPAARASLFPQPRTSSPSPPRPLGPRPPLPRLSRRPGDRGQLVGGGEGDEGGDEAKRGAEGAGAWNAPGPRVAKAGRAAHWGQAWTPGCGRREFLLSSGHLP